MTPEQRERLEYLRSKPPVRREVADPPVHFKHAHYLGFGAEPCACQPDCQWRAPRGAKP